MNRTLYLARRGIEWWADGSYTSRIIWRTEGVYLRRKDAERRCEKMDDRAHVAVISGRPVLAQVTFSTRIEEKSGRDYLYRLERRETYKSFSAVQKEIKEWKAKNKGSMVDGFWTRNETYITWFYEKDGSPVIEEE